MPNRIHPAVPSVTRRDVLRGAAGLGLLALTGCATAPRTGVEAIAADAELAALVDSIIGVDIHSHAAGAIGRAKPTYDLAEHIRTGRMTAVTLSFSADSPVVGRDEVTGGVRTFRDAKPGELWRHAQRRLEWFDGLVAAQSLRRMLKRGDLEAAHRERAPAIVQAIEGSHFLEGKLERIGEVHRRGVRHLQLVHFYLSGLGDNQTEPRTQGGMTGMGREAIVECNRLGMVVDVAHATHQFVEMAAKVSTTPLVLSHTAVTRGSTNPFTRMITFDHGKVIAQTGGVVGIWCAPYTYRNMEHYVEGLARAVDAIGVDHVALGSDNSGFFQQVAVWSDYRDFPLLVRLMRKHGFSAEDIRKIAGGNYVRVFNQSMVA